MKRLIVIIFFRPLGPLNFIRLWHDNSGKGSYASWYCKYVAVYDLQTKEKYLFIVDKWFAVEEDDGQVNDYVKSNKRSNVNSNFDCHSGKNVAVIAMYNI